MTIEEEQAKKNKEDRKEKFFWFAILSSLFLDLGEALGGIFKGGGLPQDPPDLP